MVLSLFTIEVNRGIKDVVFGLKGTPDGEGLPVRFGMQDDSIALFKNFRSEVVGEPQRRSKHPYDRRLTATVRCEEHCGPVPKLQVLAFPAAFTQGLDLQ